MSTILEATAQILDRDGDTPFTTNHLAERAGFSVGTIYQYFPNKKSIIRALAERERDKIESAVRAVLADSASGDIEPVLRAVVRIAIGVFGRRRWLRRFLLVNFINTDLAEATRQTTETVTRMIAEAIAKRGDGRIPPLTETRAFILTRAIVGPVRSAVLERSPLLDKPEFEDELVRLVRRYLEESPGSAAAPR